MTEICNYDVCEQNIATIPEVKVIAENTKESPLKWLSNSADLFDLIRSKKIINMLSSDPLRLDYKVALEIYWHISKLKPEYWANLPRIEFLKLIIEVIETGLQLGEDIIIAPKKGKLNVQITYLGMLKLAYIQGIINISSGVVKNGDIFEYEEGTNPYIKHVKKLNTSNDDGEIICTWASCENKEGKKFIEIIDKREIEVIKKSSANLSKEDVPWKVYPEQMCRKTAIKRLLKFLSLKGNKLIQKSDEFDFTDDSIKYIG